LLDYFEQLGESCILLKNDADFDSWPKNESQVVISPGPMRPSQAGNLMKMIDFYVKGNAAILGICLGHQALGEYFGARLDHALKPMHGKVSEIVTIKASIFEGLPEKFQVVRYHSLCLKDLPFSLSGIAYTNEGELMAMRHNELPIFGLQYHPEAVMTDFGLVSLKNWLQYCQ
jgi:anthranilate synthase component 2